MLSWVSEEDTSVSILKVGEPALRSPASHQVSKSSKQKPRDLKLSHLLVCLPHKSIHGHIWTSCKDKGLLRTKQCFHATSGRQETAPFYN